MSRKQLKRTAGTMASTAIAGFFILVIVYGVGLGAASAGDVDDVARAGLFGFSESAYETAALRSTAAAEPQDEVREGPVLYEQSALAVAAPRNLDAGLQMVSDMERAEQERIEAENAAAVERMEAQKAMQGVSSASEESASEDAAKPSVEYNLPAVDWSVGREAFIAEWTARIDAYLAGSPLEGYGSVFAEAAWDNGVDPRWSPAISNTESSKGAVCFKPYNAWGWGNTSWGDWDTAIRAHVAGLASAYGYGITEAAAQTYCPPTWQSWYSNTLNQMALI